MVLHYKGGGGGLKSRKIVLRNFWTFPYLFNSIFVGYIFIFVKNPKIKIYQTNIVWCFDSSFCLQWSGLKVGCDWFRAKKASKCFLKKIHKYLRSSFLYNLKLINSIKNIQENLENSKIKIKKWFPDR